VDVFLQLEPANLRKQFQKVGPRGNVLSFLRGEHRPPPRKSGGVYRRASTRNRPDPGNRGTCEASRGHRPFGQWPNLRSRDRPAPV